MHVHLALVVRFVNIVRSVHTSYQLVYTSIQFAYDKVR